MLHHGHPSRLPCGSLRSALTGPDRDASGIYRYEKMAGYALATKDGCGSRWSAPSGLLVFNHAFTKLHLTSTGLLMEAHYPPSSLWQRFWQAYESIVAHALSGPRRHSCRRLV